MSPLPLTADVHSHVIPRSLPDLEADGYARWPSMAAAPGRGGGEEATILVGGRPFRAVDARCWSPSRRAEDLDASGIDVQVVSPVPVTLCHDAPAAGAIRLARAQNDFMAGLVAEAPGRFAAFGAVPLQAPAAAVAELGRCMGDLGFAGVEIGTVAGDSELWAEELSDFWAAAAELGATVFVHPADLPCGTRLAPLDLAFGVGMPTETGITAAGLVVSGLMAAHPSLQVLLAHGGGSLAWILPRLDQGWEILPGQRQRIPEPPSHYARRFLVDTLTYDAANLALAADRFGAGHLLLGTDSPFAAREDPPGAALAEAVKRGLLDEGAAQMVRGGNAARLLALPHELPLPNELPLHENQAGAHG